MIKVFCDRCGKEIGEYEAYVLYVEAPQIKAWGDDYMYDRKGYQVCRDCIQEVADYITANKAD